MGEGALTLGLRARIDPAAEWAQIFDDAWRFQRDYFYAPNLHGADWAAVRAMYEPWLADVEELNRRAVGSDPLEVTKLSVGALATAAEGYGVLSAGAALGRGVGPLVVSAAPRELADLSRVRIAVPGRRTTAFLLLTAVLAGALPRAHTPGVVPLGILAS